MPISLQEGVEKIFRLVQENRPASFEQFGFVTDDFRIDFANIFRHAPDRANGYIYLDIYGTKVDPSNWTAAQFAAVVMSHRDTHCLIDTLRQHKEKNRPIPDYIHQIVDIVVAADPFGVPEKFDRAAAGFINTALALDLIKTRGFDLSREQRKKLTQAVVKLTDGLKGLFPAFDDFANAAYRDLGYFELDPFAKRITVNKLNALDEENSGENRRALCELSVGDIYKDIFGPRLRELSHQQRRIIHALVESAEGLSESDLTRICGTGDDPQSQSAFRQELAELADLKALSVQGEIHKMRGGEFMDWYTAVCMPRRRQHARPLISPPCDIR